MKKKNKSVIYSMIFMLTTSIIGIGIYYFTGIGGPLFETKDTWVKIDGSEASIEIETKQEADNDEIEVKEEEKYIKVYVCGEVNNPGVITIKEGDRIEDAIKLAGGTTDKFYRKGINLAKKLHDEDIVVVPSIDDPVDIHSDIKQSKVNINSADMQRLITLPGIGESTAKAIIKYRSNNKFKSTKELLNVEGIGPKKLEGIKDMVIIK